MKQPALEDSVVVVEVGFDSMIGIVELHKSKAFALSIHLLERYMNLKGLARVCLYGLNITSINFPIR